MTIYKVEMWECNWIDDYTDDGYEDWSIQKEMYFCSHKDAKVCAKIWREEILQEYPCVDLDKAVRVKEVKVL